MIVEVTVSNIVVDQAAVTHGSKHVSTGTDPIPLGTTSAAGVVQLATTGVEEATKVPKATGADLAALLTAGGYTLTAPSGANSLDGIADTSTWKKVAAAVATALNAGTYDAAKVSAFGIGTTSPTVISSTDADAIKAGGFYYLNFNCTNIPVATLGMLVVVPLDGSNTYQSWIRYTASDYPERYERFIGEGSTNVPWYKCWNAYSDGNGGQPPAPKPRSATGAGNFTRAVWTGSETKIPDGGQWVVFNYDSATELWNEPSFYAGGTTLTSSNIPNKYLCWRLTE